MAQNPRAPVPPVDYTSRDWLGFREFMLRAAQQKVPEWETRKASDFGVLLVELFAYMGDILSFYGDRIANESYLRTAVQRRSVLDIANMLGYIPSRGSAATVTLQFSILDGATNTPDELFYIPACTQVQTKDNVDSAPVIFELDEDTFLDTALTPGQNDTVNVTATEGVKVQQESLGVSSGAANQRFVLAQSPVIEGTVEIYVDEGVGFTLWQRVNNLLEGGASEATYSLLTDETGVTVIRFGDDRNGRVPLVGSQIRANYRVGGGQRGNVEANKLVRLVEPLEGVLSVTNPLPASGGADPESLNEIRVNAPKALSTLERAVSLVDHANLCLRVPGVARATAVDQGVITNTQNIDLVVKATGGNNASTTLKEQVRKYIQERTMINHLVTVVDATDVQVDITVTVVVQENFSQQRVQEAVELNLARLLSFDRVDFNHRLTVSAVYNVIQSTSGVDYGAVDILARTGLNGVGDIEFIGDEFPRVGTITVNVSGGIQE